MDMDIWMEVALVVAWPPALFPKMGGYEGSIETNTMVDRHTEHQNSKDVGVFPTTSHRSAVRTTARSL
jgi:hypothetical protein